VVALVLAAVLSAAPAAPPPARLPPSAEPAFVAVVDPGHGGDKEGAKRSRKDDRRAAAEAREQSQLLRKAAKAAEADIATLEARKTEIERAMFDPSTATAADAALTMGALMKLHAEIGAKLADMEARWLETSEAIEESKAA
jgi:ATP-binding cassette subfamily F protein 3